MRENRSKSVTIRLTKQEKNTLKTYCLDNDKTPSFVLRERISSLAQSTERYSSSGEVQLDNNR